MKNSLLLFLSLSSYISFAQCSIRLCQTCGHKDIDVFDKDGHLTESGIKINDSCVTYTFIITEPAKIPMLVDEISKQIETVWIDPYYRNTRRITIDNCKNKIIREDTIPLDIDDNPEQKITNDYMSGKISTQDSMIYYQNNYEEKYIRAHPDSFLAAYYLKSLIHHLTIEKAIEYRDKVKKNNNQYVIFRSIDSYIENYNYKSIPKLGDDFFEFKAKQTDGIIFDSKAISDKVIVLFFWYPGCGPCHRVSPYLYDLYKRYKDSGLEIICFSFGSDEESWKKDALLTKFPGINTSDLTGYSSKLFLHYAVSAFPFFLVFDKNKKIRMITFGDDEVPLVESKVKELLNIK